MSSEDRVWAWLLPSDRTASKNDVFHSHVHSHVHTQATSTHAFDIPPPFHSSLPPSLISLQVGRNICHGSDTVENAEREIKLWFGEGTIDWASHSQDWIYE